jgi:hypothetical protein
MEGNLTEAMDTQQRIVDWIKSSNRWSCAPVSGESRETTAERRTESRKSVEATTPQREPRLSLAIHTASPTSTYFSRNSIFDRIEGLRETWIHGPVPDSISVGTSWDSQTQDSATRGKTYHEAAAVRGVCLKAPLTATILSYDPASNREGSLEYSENHSQESWMIPASPAVVSNQRRITQITSCLQCIHAGLPCSRTAPSCSRCKRNGQGDICLLYRRRFPEEIHESIAELCTTPVLLKLDGEDEASWQGKLSLADEVRKER